MPGARGKVGDGISMDFHDFGAWAASPIAIIGSDPSAQWSQTTFQVAVALQNRSGTNVFLSDDSTATDGWRLRNGESIVLSMSETWTGTIWVVDFGLVGINVQFAIIQMDAS